MATLFISDLHLSTHRPDLTRRFLHFLQRQARLADALYILGDLFEVWIGDDHEALFHQQISTALARLNASGVATYIMPGNRDFLISSHFIRQTGCTLLADPSVITLCEIPTVLTHGDSLCTSDRQYLRFRTFTRRKSVKSLFSCLSLKLRLRIARYLRSHSQQNEPSDAAKFDVVMSELHHCLRQHSAQLIIHGHTHKPCIQLFQTDGTLYKRFVLSDWTDERGNVLIFSEDQGAQLVYFP